MSSSEPRIPRSRFDETGLNQDGGGGGKLWRWDLMGISELEAYVSDDDRALQFFKETVRFLEDEKCFGSALLWMDENPNVPFNYKLALKIRIASWHRLSKN